MPLTFDRLADAVDRVDLPTAPAPMAFADLLTALHARRYTGAVTLHFFSGTAHAAELPQEPIKFRLVATTPVDNGK